MKKGLTELVFILDRSGSMSGLESDTIGGFNGLIEKQKQEEGKARVSVVLFDDTTEVIYDRKKLKKIEPMTEDQYYVRGCTALLDALGGAINYIGNLHRDMDPDKCPEKTLFVITTDGMENASQHYSYKDIKYMIERQKKRYGWEFLFLGANIDAAAEASKIGIKASRAVTFENDSEGHQLNYRVLSETIGSVRRAKSCADASAMFDDGEWQDEIRKDYKKRHKG